jgi:hypothetical protein
MNPEKKSTTNIFTYTYTLRKDQITDFLNQLEDMRQGYLEDAVEASNYKDAREVIQYIMEK